MTENFYIDDVKEILGFSNPIKLTIQGATAHEEAVTLETAFKHQQIQQVLIGIDSYSFNLSSLITDDFPFYLYEDSLLGTIKYLTNYKNFRQGLKSLKNPYDLKEFNDNYNSMYSWQDDYSSFFTETYVRGDWERLIHGVKELSSEELVQYKSNFDRKILMENFQKTLLPIITNHSETEFYLFFPPYSALAYKIMAYQGILDEHLAFKQAVFQLLKSHKNVHLFDFNTADPITKDLKNYKDYTHYHARINQWILEQIRNKNYLILKSSDIQTDTFKQKTNILDIEELFLHSYHENKN